MPEHGVDPSAEHRSGGRPVPDAPRRSMLADPVYEQLVEQMLDGALAPGDAISIDGTARALGVSPTPVREALARLESTGSVARIALRGYRVADLPSAQEMSDIMDARLVIEPHLVELASERVTDDLLEQLQEAIEAQVRAPRGSSAAAIRDYHRADEHFHRLIALHAANEPLLRAYDALGGHGQRFRLFIGVGVRDAEYAIAEHREVLDALRRGRSSEVYRIMYDHITAVKARALAEQAETQSLPTS
ncbi:MAG: GntR family transcriptional regulator [Ornithinimicrobium sp.]